MAGINPTSGITPPTWPNPTSGTTAGKASPDKPDFGNVLRGQLEQTKSPKDAILSFVEQVDQAQQESAVAVQDLLAGKTKDILPVVAAVAKADLSFKLLMGVRNKVIEAYKQTMNMQI